MGRPKGSKNRSTILKEEVLTPIDNPDEKDIKEKYLSPIRSIRAKCMECSGGQFIEVKECTITDCPLYVYRFGKNPNRKGHKGGFVKEIIEPESDIDDFGKEDL